MHRLVSKATARDGGERRVRVAEEEADEFATDVAGPV
jgi:hypothetical protein